MYTSCQDPDVQAQKQGQDFEFQDKDLKVQKPKAQLRNWLVEKIITRVKQWCATMKMIYWSRYNWSVVTMQWFNNQHSTKIDKRPQPTNVCLLLLTLINFVTKNNPNTKTKTFVQRFSRRLETKTQVSRTTTQLWYFVKSYNRLTAYFPWVYSWTAWPQNTIDGPQDGLGFWYRSAIDVLD